MRLALRALAVALAAGTVACSSPEARVARRVARAEQLVREHREDEALLELDSALAIDPRSAAVNQRIGELLAERGAAADAAAHFGEAYRLDPNRIEAALREAALLAVDKPERAQRIIERALQTHPGEPAVHRTAASLALARRDFARALAAAREAIELDRTRRESWMQLGAVERARAADLVARGAPAEPALQSALDAYREAESLAGSDVAARVETARTLASWPARRSEAAESFRRAIELAAERGDADSRYAAAAALERFARSTRDSALELEALREEVTARPGQLASWERFGAANGAAAVDLLAQAIRGGADDPLLWEQLVRLDLALRRESDARAHQRELARRHPGDPAARRSEARLALAAGRADDAADALRDLEGERADAESELLRAQLELARGDLAAAKVAAARAAELAPGFSASAERTRAAVHAAAREWPEALAAIDRIASRGLALTADGALIRVRALYARGDRDRAKRELVELLAQPVPDAAVEFAQREGAAEPERARAYLERAHRAAPAHYAVLEAFTRLDLRSDQPARALARIDRVIEQQRTGARILLLRAEVLASLGRFSAAEADALRALEAAPDLPRAIDLAFAIYAAQDKLEPVRRSLEEAETAGALHGGARALLARLYFASGEVAKAQEICERVVAESPEIAAAKNDLAFMLASRGGDLARALSLAEQAERALPDSANAADTRGFVLLRLGRYEAALDPLRAALARAEPGDPSLPTFHYHHGLALAGLARGEEAAAEFDRALALDAGFPGAADARTRLASLRASR
ncbi:MAG TPA: hypothetical protein VKH41_13760 [Myxococcota bacterium]|nr:hypothetical protein [Myxococcota bacterium]